MFSKEDKDINNVNSNIISNSYSHDRNHDSNDGLFKDELKETDPECFAIIKAEERREKETLQLIASENFASKAVCEAQGSIFTNKYAEGYPAKRYYNGCQYADEIESLAIERLCKLFNCKHANVQSPSGSQANQAVFLSLLNPGDTILGFSLSAGGHLTHGAKPNLSGKWFNAIHYGVHKDSFLIDMEEVKAKAQQYKPKLIIAGASAYSRIIDFKAFREIADSVGAFLLADVAHYAGLIAAGYYPSPLPHAHIVTSTTHKTLRGPRGAIIITNEEELIKKINSAIFPGLQGGPQMHAIAAKATAFAEALRPEFKNYIKKVIDNAIALSTALQSRDFNIVTGGTETHMVLVDLRNKNIKGNIAAQMLEDAGIICNKNGVPFDIEKPMVTSGLRFGSPAETTRGLEIEDFKYIGSLIADVLEGKQSSINIKAKVKELTTSFPFYQYQ